MKDIILRISFFVYNHINKDLGLKMRGLIYKLPSVKREWKEIWKDTRINGEEVEMPQKKKRGAGK